MSTSDNKALVRRFVEQHLNTGDLAAVDDLVAPDAVDHSLPPGLPPTREGFKMAFGALRAAFPDLHYHVDDELAEGDKVFQRVTGHGTLQGEFQGMPPTGKHGTWTEMHIVRFAGGKIVEHWANIDQMALMISVGLMQPPGA